jgi:hypothetical protein
MTLEQQQLIYHAIVGVDTCKGGCGTTLSYPPTVGNTTTCPNCNTVHIIIDGGLLELAEFDG